MPANNNYQHIIFNQKGQILESNDLIFPSQAVRNGNASDLIAFGESIFPYIFNVLKAQKSITFSGLQPSLEELPGTYDFIFSKKEGRQNVSNTLIDCWIIDRTDYYEDIQQFWQNYREELIAETI